MQLLLIVFKWTGNTFVLNLFLSDGRKNERELESGELLPRCPMILQADSHDVSLVKNVIVVQYIFNEMYLLKQKTKYV